MTDVPSKPVGVPLIATSPPDGRFAYGLSIHVVNDLNPPLPVQERRSPVPSPLHLVPILPASGHRNTVHPALSRRSGTKHTQRNIEWWKRVTGGDGRWYLLGRAVVRLHTERRIEFARYNSEATVADSAPAGFPLILLPSRFIPIPAAPVASTVGPNGARAAPTRRRRARDQLSRFTEGHLRGHLVAGETAPADERSPAT